MNLNQLGICSFLPRIVDSLVSLLESGADREPEIVEQVGFYFCLFVISILSLIICFLGTLFDIGMNVKYLVLFSCRFLRLGHIS